MPAAPRGLAGVAFSGPCSALLRLFPGAALVALVGQASRALSRDEPALLLERCPLLGSLCRKRCPLLVSPCLERCCPRTRGLGLLREPRLLACTRTAHVQKRASPRLPALPTQLSQVSGCPWKLVFAQPLGVVEYTATKRSQCTELGSNRVSKSNGGNKSTARAFQLRIAVICRVQNELELVGQGPPPYYRRPAG